MCWISRAPIACCPILFSQSRTYCFYLAACLQGTQALEKTMRYALRCPQVTPPWSLWTADSGKSLCQYLLTSLGQSADTTHIRHPLSFLLVHSLFYQQRTTKQPMESQFKQCFFGNTHNHRAILIKATVEYLAAKYSQRPLGRCCCCVCVVKKKRNEA